MTYEEKLSIIIDAIQEARKRMGGANNLVKIFITKDNHLKDIYIHELNDILKHLEIESAIQVMKLPKELEPYSVSLIDEGSYFLLAIKGFDEWYGQFLIKEKSRVENLSDANFNEIYTVLTQIEDQLQFSQSGKFNFSFVSSNYDIDGYDSRDIDILENGYLKVFNYLKKANVINDFSHGAMSLDADISLNIGNFYEILKKAKKRKGNKKVITEIETEESLDFNKDIKVKYESKTGVLKINSQQVRLRKDSFRGKLIALLLENEKNMKKLWNWDEIMEKIQGIKDDEGLKDNKKKFYPACDGLQKFIAQKISINDLLIFDNTTVQINPKYI
jgi:hypothetical protein